MDSGVAQTDRKKRTRGAEDVSARLVEELRELRELFGIPRRLLVTAGASSDYEKVDPHPAEPTVPFDTPPSLTEMVKRQIENVMAERATEDDIGTFAEEDDYSMEDWDAELGYTAYEMTEQQLEAEFDLLNPEEPPREAEPTEEPEPREVPPTEPPMDKPQEESLT